ncbi:MAG: hypothetical protein Q8R20_03475 [Nanoarchaeota archaeon]|nr:hypothetical protein [Nanoarchaeota archaeon]
MSWCFAVVNNKLAEIFFDDTKRKLNIRGHCYVKEEEYTSKKEKKWIEEDVARFRFVYRDKKYKRVGFVGGKATGKDHIYEQK